MSGRQQISNSLIVVALLTFVISLFSLVSYSNDADNDENRVKRFEIEQKANDTYDKFSHDWGTDNRPTYRLSLVFLMLAIFVSTLRPRKIFISAFLTLIPFGIIVYWLVQTNRALETNDAYRMGEPYLLKIATIYDYVAFAFIAVLLFWQVHIILRGLYRTRGPETTVLI